MLENITDKGKLNSRKCTKNLQKAEKRTEKQNKQAKKRTNRNQKIKSQVKS